MFGLNPMDDSTGSRDSNARRLTRKPDSPKMMSMSSSPIEELACRPVLVLQGAFVHPCVFCRTLTERCKGKCFALPASLVVGSLQSHCLWCLPPVRQPRGRVRSQRFDSQISCLRQWCVPAFGCSTMYEGSLNELVQLVSRGYSFASV